MNINDIRKPGMPKGDWEFILKHLKPTFIMFEWGAGGSTTFFSYFVKILYSIEHENFWFVNTINAIEKEKRGNIILYWVPAPEDNYTTYVNKIDDLKHIDFDVVLIDGRARVECAKKLLGYIRDDCIVFLHDAERKRYEEIFNYYTIIDRTNTLCMLKKNGKNK